MIPANYDRWSVNMEDGEKVYTFHGCRYNEDGNTIKVRFNDPYGDSFANAHARFVNMWPNLVEEYGGAS